MKFKGCIFTVLVLLLDGSFVGSQSIQGLFVPKGNRYAIILPKIKTIKPIVSTRDSLSLLKTYTLPKGYLLPKKGQNNTFLSQTANRVTKEVNNIPTINTHPNIPVTIEQQQNNLGLLNNDIQSHSDETVDTSGFTRIPTLETIPVTKPVSSGLEEVDTTGFTKIPTLESINIQKPVSTGLEQVDTARLMSIRNNTTTGIETNTHSIETVDTSRLATIKNNGFPFVDSHFSSSSETVDTAFFLAKIRPVINQDSLNYILNKPKPIYKSQTLSGVYLPSKGKNNMIKPVEIDTTTYLAPIPAPKNDFNFPGSENYPDNKANGIGQLNEIKPEEIIVKHDVATQLGELTELPENTSDVKIDSTVNTTKSTPVIDPFYRFYDGTIYYDTTKVLTNTRGRSFSGSLISKPGKSSVLMPTVNQNDLPNQTSSTTNNSNADVLSGSLIDGASNSKNNNSNNKVNTNNSSTNSDDLKAVFYVNQSGKVTVCFTCNAYYINVTQWGYISDFVFRSTGKKDQVNNIVHKNSLGMVDNIGGVPIEYTEEHLITKVGTWPLRYTFDNMVESVGEYKVYYNSSANVKKIDKYKVNYDINKLVLNIEDSGGLIVFKTEEKKK